jgi:hypothetical protein
MSAEPGQTISRRAEGKVSSSELDIVDGQLTIASGDTYPGCEISLSRSRLGRWQPKALSVSHEMECHAASVFADAGPMHHLRTNWK